MTKTYRLYRTPIPEDSLDDTSERSDARLSTQGLLGGGSSVEAISGSPSDVDLSVQYRGRYSIRLGVELKELLKSQALQTIPLGDIEEQTEVDGYYAAGEERFGRLQPQAEDLVSLEAGLTLVGTRSSHKRVVSTRPSQPDPGNIFGNDTTALVGAPADATGVRWYGDDFLDSASAEIVKTVGGKFGDVNMYDAKDAPDDVGDNPTLVYRSASYDGEGNVDVGVWDTHGESNIRDSDDIVQWNRVFDPAHDPADDRVVVENGIVRLWLSDSNAEIKAEEWDADAEEWTAVSLPDTGWELVETDLTRIGAVAVEAQCVFSDGEEEYTLDLRLERGREAPQWIIPNSVSDPIPNGLEKLLEPIADEAAYVTNASLGLVSRKKLRR